MIPCPDRPGDVRLASAQAASPMFTAIVSTMRFDFADLADSVVPVLFERAQDSFIEARTSMLDFPGRRFDAFLPGKFAE